MFFLYIIDLHIEDRVDIAANPLNEKRNELVLKPSNHDVCIACIKDVNRSLDVVTEMTLKMKVTETKNEIFERLAQYF